MHQGTNRLKLGSLLELLIGGYFKAPDIIAVNATLVPDGPKLADTCNEEKLAKHGAGAANLARMSQEVVGLLTSLPSLTVNSSAMAVPEVPLILLGVDGDITGASLTTVPWKDEVRSLIDIHVSEVLSGGKAPSDRHKALSAVAQAAQRMNPFTEFATEFTGKEQVGNRFSTIAGYLGKPGVIYDEHPLAVALENSSKDQSTYFDGAAGADLAASFLMGMDSLIVDNRQHTKKNGRRVCGGRYCMLAERYTRVGNCWDGCDLRRFTTAIDACGCHVAAHRGSTTRIEMQLNRGLWLTAPAL